jgi:hypothetical protein
MESHFIGENQAGAASFAEPVVGDPMTQEFPGAGETPTSGSASAVNSTLANYTLIRGRPLPLADGWLDVTTSPAGEYTSCLKFPARCSFRQISSGLTFTHHALPMPFASASDWCSGLNYNGEKGWSLPTYGQFDQAYNGGVKGIKSVVVAEDPGLTFWDQKFWVKSKECLLPDDGYDACIVSPALAGGSSPPILDQEGTQSTNAHSVICVKDKSQ